MGHAAEALVGEGAHEHPIELRVLTGTLVTVEEGNRNRLRVDELEVAVTKPKEKAKHKNVDI